MRGVFPQVVFTFAGIPVRDTVISTWVMMVLLLGAVYWVRKTQPEALLMLVEFILDSVSSVMGRPAGPYLPLLGTLAIFIAGANVIGIVPIVSSPTRGINTPAALSLVVFFSVHYFGIRQKGVAKYLKNLADPIFLLPLEIVGQLSRTLAMALRLFGNVLSTELIVAVLFSLLPLIAPLPLVAFSMLTGILQAYIFTVLSAVYIGGAVAVNEGISPSGDRAQR
jgi:F-type H+-transporting ATPase subunit a